MLTLIILYIRLDIFSLGSYLVYNTIRPLSSVEIHFLLEIFYLLLLEFYLLLSTFDL